MINQGILFWLFVVAAIALGTSALTLCVLYARRLKNENSVTIAQATVDVADLNRTLRLYQESRHQVARR